MLVSALEPMLYVMLCYGMIQYGMVLVVLYGVSDDVSVSFGAHVVWYIMLCYVMIQYGMLCYGMVYYVMLCYGMIQYGMVLVALYGVSDDVSVSFGAQ